MEAKEEDNDLRLTKPSYIDIGKYIIKPNNFDVMKQLGYIDDKDEVRFTGNETTSQP